MTSFYYYPNDNKWNLNNPGFYELENLGIYKDLIILIDSYSRPKITISRREWIRKIKVDTKLKQKYINTYILPQKRIRKKIFKYVRTMSSYGIMNFMSSREYHLIHRKDRFLHDYCSSLYSLRKDEEIIKFCDLYDILFQEN